jgi:hypothetical protein
LVEDIGIEMELKNVGFLNTLFAKALFTFTTLNLDIRI